MQLLNEALQISPASGWNVAVKREMGACPMDGGCTARLGWIIWSFLALFSFGVYQNWNPVSSSFLQGRFFYASPQVSLFSTDFSSTCVSTAENSDPGSCFGCRFVVEEPFPRPLFLPVCGFHRVPWEGGGFLRRLCLHCNWQTHPHREQISAVFGCTKWSSTNSC